MLYGQVLDLRPSVIRTALKCVLMNPTKAADELMMTSVDESELAVAVGRVAEASSGMTRAITGAAASGVGLKNRLIFPVKMQSREIKISVSDAVQ